MMISSSTRTRSDNISITCDHNQNDYRYDYHTERLHGNNTKKYSADYEMSLEYKGLMTLYDNKTWKMFDRIMSYRYYKGRQNYYDENDAAVQLSDHQEYQAEPVMVDKNSFNEWHNNKQCHPNDGSNSCHDGNPDTSSKMQMLNLRDLMTQTMLYKTETTTANICVNDTVKANYGFDNQNHFHHQEMNAVNQTSNQSELERDAIDFSTSLPSPSYDLSTTKKRHSCPDFSPKSIIMQHDSNEQFLSNTIMMMPLHTGSSNICVDYEHGYLMTMKAPQFPEFSSNEQAPGYGPNNHQDIQENNQLDLIFELDL